MVRILSNGSYSTEKFDNKASENVNKPLTTPAEKRELAYGQQDTRDIESRRHRFKTPVGDLKRSIVSN